MHTQSNTTCRLNLPSGFPDSHYLLPSDAEPTGSVSESKRGTPYLSLLAAKMLSRWNPIHLLPISPLLSARGDRWQRIHLGGPSGWFIALSADSLASDDLSTAQFARSCLCERTWVVAIVESAVCSARAHGRCCW